MGTPSLTGNAAVRETAEAMAPLHLVTGDAPPFVTVMWESELPQALAPLLVG